MYDFVLEKKYYSDCYRYQRATEIFLQFKGALVQLVHSIHQVGIISTIGTIIVKFTFHSNFISKIFFLRFHEIPIVWNSDINKNINQHI